ncbi:DUF3630 family protein [Ferrimonas lipolytica]|uniref:DUF3630 family protein n=1 Tax=Ferrimonas lipolytica TaxID=2724191 RepID=A0A6H1UHK9_9GAMM|nr:DUF3630 family protein [Ferrimonas lipolytica]QIZ78090.1 DUF3630 family protein [Ferrimonas lipolytica]
MEPNANSLLQQLTIQSSAPEQLLWHCPLTQEQTLLMVPTLLQRLDCQLGELQQGADRLFWLVTFEGEPLELHFESLCDSLWLQGNVDDIQFLRTLAAKVTE